MPLLPPCATRWGFILGPRGQSNSDLLASSPWQEVSAAPAICGGRVHGILSWSKGSVTLGSEGFFTEVHPYAKWIMKTMNAY